ncbi:MAG: response regulator [Burkholderiales bacterium]|nr:response regulator [Burkholderiales bacterium]
MTECKRILVIEDDTVLRELLGDWLLAAGYRVALAPEGRAGIEEARASRPALVLTDIHMPGTGGAAVISEVTRLYPDVPVIAISAHFRSGHGLTPEHAMELGAARAIAKPFKRNDIVGAVMELAGPPNA